jgi:uncharacterized membrane protein YsdA (DUF1294 family)
MEFFIRNPILTFLIAINLVSLVVCVADKLKARAKKSRISEKTLFMLSAFGGSVAMYCTMILIRHKTKHKRFMIGLPVMIFVQVILLIAAMVYMPEMFM